MNRNVVDASNHWVVLAWAFSGRFIVMSEIDREFIGVRWAR
jgi:hypothetical protein